MTKKKNDITEGRTAFKPFAYPWAYEAWLEHEQAHWLHTEVPMLEDVKDWKNKLTPEQKQFLTHIFRFFTQGDIDVAGGYVTNYLPYFKQPEVRMMLLGFAAREALHIAAYSHLIETLGLPDETYNQFLEYAEMREKHEYVLNISDQNSTKQNTAKHIAVFSAFTEGMQLFSSFIMLLNFPRHGMMKGMGQIVTWSIVDETKHTESMIKLFRTYIEENKEIWNDELKGEIYSIAEKMVELEDKFIDLAFEIGEMPNLTPQDVKQYIRYIADRRLISLGMKGIFKVKKNPLPWVEEMINAPIHGNFFENRVTDYAKGALSGTWGDVWAQDKQGK
jgi:ribonucleoside-diphosphate reductase beta chain